MRCAAPSSSGYRNVEMAVIFAGNQDIVHCSREDDLPFRLFSKVQANVLQRMKGWYCLKPWQRHNRFHVP
jgi:hypothetical protein